MQSEKENHVKTHHAESHMRKSHFQIQSSGSIGNSKHWNGYAPLPQFRFARQHVDYIWSPLNRNRMKGFSLTRQEIANPHIGTKQSLLRNLECTHWNVFWNRHFESLIPYMKHSYATSESTAKKWIRDTKKQPITVKILPFVQIDTVATSS